MKAAASSCSCICASVTAALPAASLGELLQAQRRLSSTWTRCFCVPPWTGGSERNPDGVARKRPTMLPAEVIAIDIVISRALQAAAAACGASRRTRRPAEDRRMQVPGRQERCGARTCEDPVPGLHAATKEIGGRYAVNS